MNPLLDLSPVARSICSSKGLSFRNFVGGGAFKQVFRVERTGERLYALKVITEISRRTIREIKALQLCDHPNIARLFEVGRHDYQDESYDYLLEEFLPGGTLTQKLQSLGRLNNEQTLSLGEKLIDAICHIAGHRLVHRDIKPDNIMFREDGFTPVLVDFGLVRDLTAISLTQTWAMPGPGTPYYSAPEQLNNQKHLIDWRTDQFTLGVVLCCARFGTHPFQHRYQNDPRFTIERVARRRDRNGNVLNQIQDSGLNCLERMTHVWPVQRYKSPEKLLEDWMRQG